MVSERGKGFGRREEGATAGCLPGAWENREGPRQASVPCEEGAEAGCSLGEGPQPGGPASIPRKSFPPRISGAMLGAGHRPDFVSRCSLCGRALCVCEAKAEK